MKMYKINVVFMLANTTPILKPVDQGVLLSFKSYYLRNTFHKVIAAMDSDSSDGSWKSQWKTSWKGFTILDAIENICNSWKEVQISTLTGVGEQLSPMLTDDFEGFKTSVEEVVEQMWWK